MLLPVRIVSIGDSMAFHGGRHPVSVASAQLVTQDGVAVAPAGTSHLLLVPLLLSP